MLLSKDLELEKVVNYMIMATTGESCRQNSVKVFWGNPDLEDIIFKVENEKGQT